MSLSSARTRVKMRELAVVRLTVENSRVKMRGLALKLCGLAHLAPLLIPFAPAHRSSGELHQDIKEYRCGINMRHLWQGSKLWK